MSNDKIEKLLAAAESAHGAERDKLLRAAGTAVGERSSRVCARQRNHGGPGYRHGPQKNRTTGGSDAVTFMRRGGMRAIEHVAGAKAAELAIHHERLHWLPMLEAWHAREEGAIRVFLATEIRRLRRALHVGLTDDERRAQTRARVRRHRARHRGKSGL